MRSLFFALSLVAAPLGLSATASADEPVRRAEPQQVVLAGANVCLGCALKKSDGAAAQCSLYGHRHGLQVSAAKDPAGTLIAGLAGQVVHHLDNDKSADLVKGETTHGATVEVTGRLFPTEHLLEVTSFRVVP